MYTERDEYFDKEPMLKNTPWSAPMHEWTVTAHCSTGPIPPMKAEKDSTISLS